ncbi:OTU domain-containing protein 5 isoform 2-T2 [Sarcophilus harrisii]
MTILPKKPPPPSTDGESSPDGEQIGDIANQVGSDRGEGPGAGPSGVRPRSSPPPAVPRWVPSGSGRGGVFMGSRSQVSPPPGPGPPPSSSSGGDVTTGDGLGLSAAGGPVSCCSGPGLSKRRRQQICSNPSGNSDLDECGAGYNSEDEYDAAASRIETMDPATMEQQEHWFEKALKDKKGFIIKQMKEDGACLFRAVADQVYGDQDMHEVVRKHCMDYLFAEQSLMKSAIKTSEESWIEQQMLEDKKRATDWEATNEAIEEQVARESYLQWLRDQEKQTLQIKGQTQSRKASATCTSATAASSSNLEDWGVRSPRQRNPDQPEIGYKPSSPNHALTFTKPPSPSTPGPSSQSATGGDGATSPLVTLYPALECRALIQQMSPTAFGLNDWDDDGILASVLAISQQEYLDSMKKSIMHRNPSSGNS